MEVPGSKCRKKAISRVPYANWAKDEEAAAGATIPAAKISQVRIPPTEETDRDGDKSGTGR
jgi:hypothetical protein